MGDELAGIAQLVQDLLRGGGLELKKRHAYRHPALLMATKCAEFKVDTVLDIGANVGQFAGELREAGWTGRIVSFEPLAEAHRKLIAAAAGRWDVAPRVAVGRVDGELTINVSANSASSSFLQVLERSTTTAPGSAFTRTERVPVRALDGLLQAGWGERLALKIDTQGFEAEVLAGATQALSIAQVVILEVSLTPLYEGAPAGSSIFRMMEGAGFRCISIVEGFSDPQRNEMLQVDAVFVRA